MKIYADTYIPAMYIQGVQGNNKMNKKQITTEQLKPGIVILDEKTKTEKTIEMVDYEINYNGNWIVSIWFTDQSLSKWSLGIHQAYFTQIN